MLEGLKDINWKKRLGAYNLGDKLPGLIRLLMSPDEAIREQAQATVREEITHQLTVYSATPVVIPFLIEMLDSDACVNADWILDLLYCNVFNSHWAISRFRNTMGSPYIMICFETCQAVETGYETYVRYLSHPDAGTRYHAVLLVSVLTQNQDSTRFKFKRMLTQEAHPIVLANLLIKLQVPFRYSPRFQNRQKAYQDFLISFMRPNKHPLVQIAAVLGWQAIAYSHRFKKPPDTIPERVFEIYLDVIKSNIDLMDFVDFNTYSDFYLEDIIKPHTVYEKLAQLGIEHITSLLCSENLTSAQVHYLARELLETVFDRIQRTPYDIENITYYKWLRFGGWLQSQYRAPLALRNSDTDLETTAHPETPTSLTYHPLESKQLRLFESSGELLKPQKPVIQAIVDCDPFWEIETNLFSFFYGLPDDREELRALLD